MMETLTPRERDVLELISEGASNLAIAQILSITEGCVGAHIGRAYLKLDLAVRPDTNRRVLAALAFLGAREGV